MVMKNRLSTDILMKKPDRFRPRSDSAYLGYLYPRDKEPVPLSL